MSMLALINRQGTRSKLFMASGSFTAPKNVTKVYVTACAGGGGGGGASPDGLGTYGGGGGGGDCCIKKEITVTPETAYDVTLGDGGGGGAQGQDGTDGGDTTLGALLTLGGGGGGSHGINGGTQGADGAAGGSMATPGMGSGPGCSLLFPTYDTGAVPVGTASGDWAGVGGWGDNTNGSGGDGRPGYMLIEWLG